MDSRVFWGVLCALLVFSGIWAVWFALGVYAQRQAVSDALVQSQRQSYQAARAYEVQRAVQAKRVLDASVHDTYIHALADDQRCVGGVVLEVRGNVYTQVGSIAQPVHCTGRRADRPLR